MRRIALGALVAAGLVVPGVARADVLHDVRAAITNVRTSIVHRYGLHDDQGRRMDALDIVQTGRAQYVGIYHTNSGSYFTLHVATSTDMVTWTHRAMLDTDSSQGSIAAVPGGGFVVAYEKGFSPIIPKPGFLQKPLPIPDEGRQQIQIRFREYPDLDSLLAGRQSAEFTAPRTLGLGAEGTPNIQSITGGPLPAQTTIDVGFHYYADVTGDGTPDVDRQATGVLTSFSRWSTADAQAINFVFEHTAFLHPGLRLDPTGNFGDRDDFTYKHRMLAIHEVQYTENDFGSWRIFLRDPKSGRVLPVSPVTRGHSRAFANPSITPITTPSGRHALFVSLFLFAEGAGPGETGPLIYVVPVPR